jgi:very-short-patch-repair endonuclease
MSREWTIAASIGAKSSTRGEAAGLERRIADLAGRQHGVVSLSQLTALGLSAKAARGRVAAGRLHRIHQAVYVVGHPLLTGDGRWMAAVLACGERALLSHRSAAILWGLRESGGVRADVTTARRVGRGREGIRVHWRPAVCSADADRCRGIQCTSVARTLVDLAGILRADEFEKACDRAEQLRLFDGRAIDELLARARGERGTRRLREALANLDPSSTQTRTDIERRVLALCRAHPLPQPVVNGWIQLDGIGFSPDFLWPAANLIVETDSRAFHDTRRAFEADRRRDQLLAEAGYATLRFTWRQVTTEPERVARTIEAVLERSVTPTSLRGDSALERRSPARTISA